MLSVDPGQAALAVFVVVGIVILGYGFYRMVAIVTFYLKRYWDDLD